jgi:hypothetical protein
MNQISQNAQGFSPHGLGRKAFQSGVARVPPYPIGGAEYVAWLAGFDQAEAEASAEKQLESGKSAQADEDSFEM